MHVANILSSSPYTIYCTFFLSVCYIDLFAEIIGKIKWVIAWKAHKRENIHCQTERTFPVSTCLCVVLLNGFINEFDLLLEVIC